VPEPRSEDAAKVAGIFGYLADRDFHGYSRLYEHLARRVAHDDAIPVLVTRANQRSHAPVLFFACVRDILLRHPETDLAQAYDAVAAGADPAEIGVWPMFRSFVLDRADEVSDLLRTRKVQTNEVGRSAALGPAVTGVAAWFERPVALIEIGASAGLNLLFDRYCICYDPRGQLGPSDSPVQIECTLRGPRHPDWSRPPPEIVSRLGIDQSPVDVTDDDAVEWLRACVWPDVPGRTSRFDAAVSLARADPPTIWSGHALDLVTPAVEAVPDDVVPCLISTWVLAYLTPEERADLAAQVEALAQGRDLAYLTAEYEMTVPWLGPAPRRPTIVTSEIPTRLGAALWSGGRMEPRMLGWMHAHALWLEWLDEG
jgi:hypothetical protein